MRRRWRRRWIGSCASGASCRSCRWTSQMPLSLGARVTLDAERPVAGGWMLARHDGQVVLVAGAIPGERITARVTRVARGTVYADTVEVVTASPDRRPGVEGRC